MRYSKNNISIIKEDVTTTKIQKAKKDYIRKVGINKKDYLLNQERLSFYVDEIFYDGDIDDSHVFGVHIIPDVDSKFYPPSHLRYLWASIELFNKEYISYVINRLDIKNDIDNIDFKNSIIQGGYYSIPTENIPDNIFDRDYIFTSSNDIFTKYKTIPHGIKISSNEIKEVEYVTKPDNSTTSGSDNLYLYCFNVGQGDSALLITPTKNCYLIDVNICSAEKLQQFTNDVKRILTSHRIEPNNITGLIITHQHIDHLRGAWELVKPPYLNIDKLYINCDYKHNTAPVNKLILSASTHISQIINVNKGSVLIDGEVYIEIVNPDNTTAKAHDINDSSICLCIKYKNNHLCLSGDVGYKILNSKLSKYKNYKSSLLKVSHHGSRTGTNDKTIEIMSPTHAFISCGETQSYDHPHKEAINSFKPLTELIISKKVRNTIRYTLNGSSIISAKI